MLWGVLTLMTAAAVFAVLWPLGRKRSAVAPANDVAVYRDQLDEIERDRVAGTIGTQEAEAARVEISRRLIAAADAARIAPPVEDVAVRRRHRRVAAVAALVAVPAGATLLYLTLGSPNLPSQPLAPRLVAVQDSHSLAGMIARVEGHLEKSPDDGRGWEVIAPIYLRLGRFADAARAYTKTLSLLGETGERQASLGEAMVAAADGVVTAEARAAFERAIVLDHDDARAHFYLGLAAEQDGDRELAARRWRALLERAPEGAAWADSVREALSRVENHSSVEAPGPTADDISAAAKLSPADRDNMVHNMIDGLARRLRADGSDADGWTRLMRAYVVLGETDKARAAVADARRALASDSDRLRRINEVAKSIGIGD